jgi:hypothetical protein
MDDCKGLYRRAYYAYILLISFILQGEKYVDNYTSDPHNLKILHYEGDSLIKHLSLYSCDLRDAPERYDSDSMCSILAFLLLIFPSFSPFKESNTSLEIEHVGTVAVDFRNVNLNHFERKKVNGIETTVLQYSIKVIFGAEEGVLKFLVIAKDAVIGTADIEFSQKTNISQVHVPRSSLPGKVQKSVEYNSPKKGSI